MIEKPEGEGDAAGRSVTLFVYILQLLGLLVVFPPIIGLAVNYFHRDSVQGTIYASHFTWQIRTVWWALLWGLLGGALMYAAGPTGQPIVGIVGALVILVMAFWFMYRLIKGYVHFASRHPLPVPPHAP